MKITAMTPPAERTFTLQVTESELRYIQVTLGVQTRNTKQELAERFDLDLSRIDTSTMYNLIADALQR